MENEELRRSKPTDEKKKLDKKFLIIGGVVVLIIIAIFIAVFANRKTHTFGLNKKELNMAVGDTFNIKLAEETDKVEVLNLTWESDNSKVATVNSNGKIVAKAKGKTTISTEYDGDTYEAKVEVNDLKFTMAETLEFESVGKSSNIKVTENSLNSVKFTVEDKSIVDLDEKTGNVKAKKEGTTKIIGKLNDVTKECVVVVGAKAQEELKAEENKATQEASIEQNTQTNNGTQQSNTNTPSTSTSTNNTTNNTSSNSSSNTSTSNRGNSSSNSSSSSNNSGQSSGNTGGNTSSQQPSQPQVSYSYYGATAVSYLKGQGGRTVGSTVYLGNPQTGGISSGGPADYILSVTNYGQPNKDYVVGYDDGCVEEDGLGNVDFMRQKFAGLFENGSEVFDHIRNGERNFTVGGRNYSVSSSQIGRVVSVSAKKN